MTNLYNKQELKSRRRQLRQDSTKAEQVIWQCIRNSKLGYKFRRQYSIGSYVADFCCPELKLIVEIDGAYHDYGEQIEYDNEREEYLKAAEFKIIRFRNEEIEDDYILVSNKIKRECLKIKKF